jgi:hypothetical protein
MNIPGFALDILPGDAMELRREYRAVFSLQSNLTGWGALLLKNIFAVLCKNLPPVRFTSRISPCGSKVK